MVCFSTGHGVNCLPTCCKMSTLQPYARLLWKSVFKLLSVLFCAWHANIVLSCSKKIGRLRSQKYIYLSTLSCCKRYLSNFEDPQHKKAIFVMFWCRSWCLPCLGLQKMIRLQVRWHLEGIKDATQNGNEIESSSCLLWCKCECKSPLRDSAF